MIADVFVPLKLAFFRNYLSRRVSPFEKSINLGCCNTHAAGKLEKLASIPERTGVLIWRWPIRKRQHIK